MLATSTTALGSEFNEEAMVMMMIMMMDEASLVMNVHDERLLMKVIEVMTKETTQSQLN